MSELKPCPFCDTTPKQGLATTVSRGVYIEQGEGCAVCQTFCNSEDWNARPFEAKAVEVLAEELLLAEFIFENKESFNHDDDYTAFKEAIRENVLNTRTSNTLLREKRAEAKQLLGVK